jgi:hypothetical protein
VSDLISAGVHLCEPFYDLFIAFGRGLPDLNNDYPQVLAGWALLRTRKKAHVKGAFKSVALSLLAFLDNDRRF